MTTNITTKPDVLFTESPVSWNTRYITPDGFECQFTLRERLYYQISKLGSANRGQHRLPGVINEGHDP